MIKILCVGILWTTLFVSCAQNEKKVSKETTKKSDIVVNTLAMEIPHESTISCKLTTPELQARKATAIKQLKDKFKKRIEQENGYSYVFDDSDQTLDMLNDFIKTERQCCDFFSFNIAVSNKGSITFSITGNKGAKDFISSELGM